LRQVVSKQKIIDEIFNFDESVRSKIIQLNEKQLENSKKIKPFPYSFESAFLIASNFTFYPNILSLLIHNYFTYHLNLHHSLIDFMGTDMDVCELCENLNCTEVDIIENLLNSKICPPLFKGFKITSCK